MATVTWTGYLSFFTFTVPVKLYAAAREERTGFNQVHQCGEGRVTRINKQNFCSCCQKTVEFSELSKGFEVGENQYFVLDESELKALKPGKSDQIAVTEFVPLSEIDPIFFDSSFFVVPETAGRKAYELLYQTMKDTNLAGRASYVSRGTEYNIFIRVYGKGLMIHTVFAASEVRSLPEYDSVRDDVQVTAQELKMAKMLLEAMVAPFNSASLKNEYEERVSALVAQKRAAVTPAQRPVADITEALNASLAAIAARKPKTSRKSTKAA